MEVFWPDRMMQWFDKIHKEMMKGFFDHGNSLLTSDSFLGWDPFFKDSFGGIDKMFKEANSMMKKMDSHSFTGGNGHFMKQTYVMNEKWGPDGRPQWETYQTKASGVLDSNGRTKLGERQQLYQNDYTGYEKMGHERMYDGRGWKYLSEGIGHEKNTHHIYKGITENEA